MSESSALDHEVVFGILHAQAVILIDNGVSGSFTNCFTFPSAINNDFGDSFTHLSFRIPERWENFERTKLYSLFCRG